MTQSALHLYLETMIPASLSCPWDNDGAMLLPQPDKEVKSVLVALDCTEQVATYAIEKRFDVILTHHPLIFKPLSGITDPLLTSLIRAGIAVFSYHTRLDARAGGVNDCLADLFDLQDRAFFGEDNMGRIGSLPSPMTPEAFGAFVKERLNAPTVTAYLAKALISRVAVLGGSGKDFLDDAVLAGADAFVTGEVSYNALLDATRNGISLYVCGHYHTEQPVCTYLASLASDFGAKTEIIPSYPFIEL